MDNMICVEFINKSSNESFARMVAAVFACELDPTIEELAEIKTAVSEAVTNSIVHGYANKEGMVKLFGRIDGDTLEYIVSDEGEGIEDIKKAMEPLYTSKPEEERSGMGFAIMESFMDSVEVKSEPGKGCSVRMTKRISRQ